MVFEGSTECMNVFIVSIPNERKRNMRIRNGFKICFCSRSYLSNDNIISANRARSENGCGKLHFFGLK